MIILGGEAGGFTEEPDTEARWGDKWTLAQEL